MGVEIANLYRDLNKDTARFKVPFKSLFLCGGVISGVELSPPLSLRDYLFRVKGLKLACNIVRAEAATQLYRDTTYTDLIEFEADIARVASIVLVIAESPGSLAELGAFTVNPTIRRSLRVIAQAQYQDAESFIRFGPIQRIRNLDSDSVGFYPWRMTNGDERLVASTAKPHLSNIRSFIRDHIESIPSSRKLVSNVPEQRIIQVVYWSLYLLYAASLTVLHQEVKTIFLDLTVGDLKNRLYCMKLMGWIGRESYSNKEFYFSLGQSDPVTYNFPKSIKNNDAVSRAKAVRVEVDAQERIPRHIIRFVAEQRLKAS